VCPDVPTCPDTASRGASALGPTGCAQRVIATATRFEAIEAETCSAGGPISRGDLVGEPGKTPAWVPLATVRDLHLRPPIGGYLPGIVSGTRNTAAYLGNMWRPSQPIRGRAGRGQEL